MVYYRIIISGHESIDGNRLKTSILNNSINDIGKYNKVKRLVNLNADRKRN